MFELKVESHFSSAHHLLNYNGKCENQHGHNWKVEVYIRGANLDASGILVDFKTLKSELNKIMDLLDHKDLNELDFFKNVSPSSEIISKFIYTEMKKVFPNTFKVCVWETENSCACYYEEE